MKTELSEANLKDEIPRPWEMLPRNFKLVV
jgi:hypothetical protein